MKKSMFFLLTTALLLSVVFISCNSGLQDNESKLKDHEGFTYTDDGLAYKFVVRNDTAKQAKPGIPDSNKAFKDAEDEAKPNIAYVKLKYGTPDTLLYDSDILVDKLVPIPLTPPAYPGDFMEGLEMMHVGDSAIFVVDAESFFLKTARFPEIPEYAAGVKKLTFYVKLEDIKTEDQAREDYAEQLVKMQIAEDSTLQAYIKEHNITVKPTETGLYFQRLKKGKGPLAKKGDLVTVDFDIKLLNGTKIFSTKETGEPVFFELGKPYDTEGMNQALLMMRQGGKARIIMPSNLAFGKRGRPGLVPPYSTLISEIELVNIQTQEEYQAGQRLKEALKIEQYVKDSNINVKPTSSGLYYVEKVKGDGPKAEPGDKVKVWYTGKLLDGTVFDASSKRNKPFEFVLGKGRVIKGWDEGIAMMRQGGKATLIIPSSLGYGERGSGKVIPPNSPLIFDVELQEVIKQ